MAKRILIIIGIILLLLIAAIVFFSVRNAKQVDALTASGMEALSEHVTLTEKDPGEYKNITIYHLMPFETKQYEAEGIGNLSVMRLNFGPMQMLSFILAPYEKDAPLLSSDFIYMLGKRTGILELYDLTEDMDREDYQAMLTSLKAAIDQHSSLADSLDPEAWYNALRTVHCRKSASMKQDEELKALFTDAIRAYAQSAKELPAIPEEEKEAKRSRIEEYATKLVDMGGLSTDIFKKQLGVDVTRNFFAKVFFGYER